MKTTFASQSKGQLYVGPIRVLQKRNPPRPCKRNSKVPRYADYYKECFNQRFTEDDQYKVDILKDLPEVTDKSKLYDDRSWARYT